MRERAVMAHFFAQHTDGERGITILFHDQNSSGVVLVHHPLVQGAG
jgi:hypothetical protein